MADAVSRVTFYVRIMMMRRAKESAMPTYEYRCERCGEIFERRESIAEHEAAKQMCPKCGSEDVFRALSAFFTKTSKKS
jgi:putative FmdB family regulatory protein